MNTQRIVVPPAKDLPAWFWGAVGCFSVLAVGLVVLFIVIARPSETGSASAASATSAVGLARGPGAAPGRGGIQVEPMASPSTPTIPLAASRPRASKVIKVARTASRPSESTPSKEGAAGEQDDKAEPAPAKEEPDEEELLRPRGRSQAAEPAPENE